ncbi:hypothetical protein [Streptomyces mirabilis]
MLTVGLGSGRRVDRLGLVAFTDTREALRTMILDIKAGRADHLL